MKNQCFRIMAVVVICAAAGLVSCSKKVTETSADGSVNPYAGQTLYLFNWTYYTPDSVIEKFEKEFGVTVKIDTFDSNEVMYAKLKAGATGYDITFPSQDYASIMIKQGMLKEIDQSKLTNKKYINPKVLTKATYDPEMKYCVPYYMGAAGVAVNKQKVKNYEKSWTIFSRADLKGHMSMMDDMREIIGDALAYQGHSVNTVDDGELAAARDLINNEWKPNLVKFDAEGFGKSFASGNFWVCQGYPEVIYGEVPENKQADMIDFFIPKEGGPMYIDSMVIPQGGKHFDLAMEFINFIQRPQIYAEFLDTFRFPSSVNTEAENYMKTTPIYKADEIKNCELKEDVGAGLEKYNNIWQSIRFTAD